MQNYLKSNLFSDYETEFLFKLRSETTELKSNFKTKYNNNVKCSINGCDSEEKQEHIFSNCDYLRHKVPNEDPKVKYQDIYFSLSKKQYKVTKIFIELMNERENILNLQSP